MVVAAWLCRAGEEIFAEKDSQKIVLDEIAGFLLANFHLPAKLEIIIAAFLLFRFFDIIKRFLRRSSKRAKTGSCWKILLPVFTLSWPFDSCFTGVFYNGKSRSPKHR
jgi:phosphatidylglycerophosphatase A